MRSSERPSGKTIDTTEMRTKFVPRGVKQEYKPVQVQYCRDCNKRKRGNTYKDDHCRYFKRKCVDIRTGQGMIAYRCKGFGEK